ncbi:MAG: hypothetical protein K1X64_14310 [Myxococcaceae bacterium]|nr:hypothetical protein [Myxococcaceae bacterium]
MSSWLEKVNAESDVVPAGWFEPQSAADPIVRFTVDTSRKDAKGKTRPHYLMRVNSHYAHVQADALHALAVFEFSRFAATLPQTQGPHKPDSLLWGLLATAFELQKDTSWRDQEVWTALLTRYQLPSELALSDFLTALSRHQSKFYAGDENGLAYLKQVLDPPVLRRLAEPQAGTLLPIASPQRTAAAP